MATRTTRTLIVDGVRTPLGAMGGALATVPAPVLGAACLRALVERTGLPAEKVDEVLMGNCIAAGLGMNPARQAGVFGGLPVSTGATTLNKACASGMLAVTLADRAIRLGEARACLAGGMENMTRAPYLLLKAREGYRMGTAEMPDALIHDGLTDPFGRQHMGTYADACAVRFGFSREAQDNYAVRSHLRAREAASSGASAAEIVPVEVTVRGTTTLVTADEGPSRFDEAKLRGLRSAFTAEGTVTAGNASSINDGAAALLLASAEACDEFGLSPRAEVVGSAVFSREPEWFTIAPAGAVRKLLDRVGWSVADVDLFEVNEAFAAVAMAAEAELGLNPEKLNVHGGAVALGHPIGCSGARVLVTLLNALERTGKARGVATLCVGGGEGIAMAIERVG